MYQQEPPAHLERTPIDVFLDTVAAAAAQYAVDHRDGPPTPTTTGSCGGCAGLGAHKRWCPAAVGHIAAHYGFLAEQAEDLADRATTSADFANSMYAAASKLYALAVEEAERWQAEAAALPRGSFGDQ
jgi:hypothetical protein